MATLPRTPVTKRTGRNRSKMVMLAMHMNIPVYDSRNVHEKKGREKGEKFTGDGFR